MNHEKQIVYEIKKYPITKSTLVKICHLLKCCVVFTPVCTVLTILLCSVRFLTFR